jgi:nucleotide-binding universal stress UspA family protein
MYKRILVTLDGSDLAEMVIPHVEVVAEPGYSEVILLHVAPVPEMVVQGEVVVAYADQEEERLRMTARRYLDRFVERLRAQGIEARGAVRFGAPGPQILEAALAEDADLIAMTTHGRSGLQRLFYGSVAEEVLRGAKVPILLVRGGSGG